MDKLKWWHGEWFERQRINEAAAELSTLDTITDSLSQQVGRLFELDRDQGREIARLQAAVGVLMELLIQNNLVQEGDLRAKLDSAFAALEPQHTAQPGHPYRGDATPDQAPPERKVACRHCGKEVPIRSTFVTAAGEVCDQCYYANLGDT
jgi:hypothetical protein